jgi:hypothetical protein
MGGFLFGFDTAVINGAVDAIRVWSGAASWLLGFAVAGALLGALWRLHRSIDWAASHI